MELIYGQSWYHFTTGPWLLLTAQERVECPILFLAKPEKHCRKKPKLLPSLEATLLV